MKTDRQPITLRAKALANGRKSLYLDIYTESKDKNHSHRYEFLKLYLLPDTTKDNREQNKNTLKAAKAIQAQRLIDRANGKANITKSTTKSAIRFTDYMEHFAEQKEKYGQSNVRSKNVLAFIKHIKAYKGNVLLADIDKAYCLGLIFYLSNAKTLNEKEPQPLSKQTATAYYKIFVAVLNQAVKDDLISINPTCKISIEEKKPIQVPGTTRTYLTIEELQRLIDAKCGNEDIRNAFLFACYTGLRLSDIISLTWDDIKTENGKMQIVKQMTKTKQIVTIPLGKAALQYLPQKTAHNVFPMTSCPNANKVLKTWAKRAKVTKKITFHTSRHTFATMLLTKGADLYTVSKLLGHTNISITQIYAEIVNAKKVDAINLLDD